MYNFTGIYNNIATTLRSLHKNLATSYAFIFVILALNPTSSWLLTKQILATSSQVETQENLATCSIHEHAHTQNNTLATSKVIPRRMHTTCASPIAQEQWHNKTAVETNEGWFLPGEETMKTEEEEEEEDATFGGRHQADDDDDDDENAADEGRRPMAATEKGKCKRDVRRVHTSGSISKIEGKGPFGAWVPPVRAIAQNPKIGPFWTVTIDPLVS
jgi:hypothetical protein